MTAYLANSTSVINEIERCYDVELPRDHIALVPHGLPERRQVDAVPTSDGSVNVLFVGRLEHRKGIDTLLEAIPMVLARCPSATFTIVGDDSIPAPGGGTYRARFEADGGVGPDARYGTGGAGAVAAPTVGRVRFLGRLDDEELERHYAGCDLLVAPSRYESFGLVLLEAMRHGKAVVAGDTGGMRDIVDGNGVLVPPGDADALASAVIDLLHERERRERLGARSLSLFAERYSDEHMVDGVERLYRQLVADHPRLARPQ